MAKLCDSCHVNRAGWDIKRQDYILDCYECRNGLKNPMPVTKKPEKILKRDLCPICKERIRKNGPGGHGLGAWCIVCDKDKRDEKRRLKREEKARLNSIFHEPERFCQECKKYFVYKSKNEKYCHDCKQYKTIRNANKRWVENKPVVRKKHITSDMVAYSFFRPKYTVPNNVCRG